VTFGAQVDMPAMRRASVRWGKRKARARAWERAKATLLRPFRRVWLAIHDRLWARVERSEAAISAAEAAEIAANADRIERLRQAALIGSATAAAALIDIAADRVGQARRSAALAAITRLREQNVIK
jgi:hypothetical protein